jgi:hypothetical protein
MVQSLSSNLEDAWGAILEQTTRALERSLPSGEHSAQAIAHANGARPVPVGSFADLKIVGADVRDRGIGPRKSRDVPPGGVRTDDPTGLVEQRHWCAQRIERRLERRLR